MTVSAHALFYAGSGDTITITGAVAKNNITLDGSQANFLRIFLLK